MAVRQILFNPNNITVKSPAGYPGLTINAMYKDIERDEDDDDVIVSSNTYIVITPNLNGFTECHLEVRDENGTLVTVLETNDSATIEYDTYHMFLRNEYDYYITGWAKQSMFTKEFSNVKVTLEWLYVEKDNRYCGDDDDNAIYLCQDNTPYIQVAKKYDGSNGGIPYIDIDIYTQLQWFTYGNTSNPLLQAYIKKLTLYLSPLPNAEKLEDEDITWEDFSYDRNEDGEIDEDDGLFDASKFKIRKRIYMNAAQFSTFQYHIGRLVVRYAFEDEDGNKLKNDIVKEVPSQILHFKTIYEEEDEE